jgi:hypothetical protein
MSSFAEREELNELSGALLKCVTSLASKCDDTPAMRRLVNDAERILNGVDRLDIDMEELELTRALTQPQASVEMIQIPDTQYDIDFWRDVDHEGIGGRGGA